VRHREFFKDAPHNPAIGAPGELDVVQRAVDAERVAQAGLQGMHPAPPDAMSVPSMSQSKSVFTKKQI